MSSGPHLPVIPPSNDNVNASQDTVSDEDTQRSLQQASDALEVASNRIREVRRSLRQLSESQPYADDTPRFGVNNDISPGHEAILLSGDGSNGPDDTPRAVRRPGPFLSEFRDAPTVTEAASASSGDGQDMSSLGAITLNFPEPPPNRPMSQQVLSDWARTMYQDTAATTRGLRVAAREAERQRGTAGVATPSRDQTDAFASDGRWNMPLTTSRSELDRTYWEQGEHTEEPPGTRESQLPELRIPAEWARLRNTMGPPATTSQTARRVPVVRGRRPSSSSSPFISDFQRGAWGEWGNGPLPLHSASGGSQWNPRAAPRNPGLPLPSRALSDDSAQTRIPTTSDEYHRYYRELLSAPDAGGDLGINWGDEHLNPWHSAPRNLYVPISHDHPDFTTRHNPLHEQSVGTVRQNIDNLRQHIDSMAISRTNNVETSSESLAPRRGWARLDADGNEISPNEEEELERSRTEYRLRALQRARQHIAGGSNGQSELSTNGALNTEAVQRTTYGSVLDATLAVQGARERPASPLAHTPANVNIRPLYVNPLPMPLASMVIMADTSKEEDIYIDISFPKYACLAGR